MKKEILKDIPSNEILEKRFSFLKDDILRSNVVIAFRYLIFLITLQEKLKFRSSIAYSIYKDIILYTTTIIESCLHYTINQYLNEKIIKPEEIMPSEWYDEYCKDIYKISDEEKVCGVIKKKKYENFSKNTQFLTINKIAKKSNILTKSLFLRADSLRKKRNKIHLAGLQKTDTYYGKKDTQIVINAAAAIVKHLENKLENLDKQKVS